MSFKKNYLNIVAGGLIITIVAMVYLKINSSHTESSVSATEDVEKTHSSQEIVNEVLASSTKEDIKNNGSDSNAANNIDNNSTLLAKEEDLKKEKQENAFLIKQSQQIKEESDRIKAESEELKKTLANKSIANNSNKICVSYGPMTIDLKNKFRNILSSNKIANALYQDKQLPQYEIFWNLGSNKLEALERFEQQKKEGALRDDKFKLTQDNNNNWIVPATTIAGDYSVADTLAKQLSASSAKFGGKWDIREKTGGHYIIFPNVNLISESILLTIDKDLRLNKTFC